MTFRTRAVFLSTLRRRRQIRWHLIAAILACLIGSAVKTPGAPTLLYTFPAPTNSGARIATNSAGQAPASKLVLASDGFLYGTTSHGGANGAGSIYRVSPAGGGFSNLYSFAAATNAGGSVNYDLGPNDLAQGADGNFYGTTRAGGSNFTGTVFVLYQSGVFSNLHTFGAATTNVGRQVTSGDGAAPVGMLVPGSDGNFYGTTQFGGSNNTGTIFQISPEGNFAGVHSFGRLGASSTNGAIPNGLTLGSDGSFYGTTQQGGNVNAGTFFRFSVADGFSQLYAFNGLAPNKNPVTPASTLAPGTNGVFYGSSAHGGAQAGGCVFSIAPPATISLVYSFPLLDSGTPAALTFDTNGIVYGTTEANPANPSGTVFRLTPNGEFSTYAFGPLNSNGVNLVGANPEAALTADNAGNLYGACADGGTNGSGVVFQLTATNFIPAYFVASSTPPPPATNTLIGASVSFSIPAGGLTPLSYQWTRNGMNLTDGGEISGSASSNLTINPVRYGDAGGYALIVSNAWGALTSAVTAVTISAPSVAIVLPKPNTRTNAPVFAGTATPAPLAAGQSNGVPLTAVSFAISNLFNGSNITGVAELSSGANGVSNWTFSAAAFPGTNILSVQSEDASGNFSPVISERFFLEATAPLTVALAGSGTAKCSITNGALLNIGQAYTIAATPVSSVFSNWSGAGVTNYGPILGFVMQPNLVLTAYLLARQAPSASITVPTQDERTTNSAFEGTVTPSPLLAGVNPNNTVVASVTYWLTNSAGSVQLGVATLAGGAVTNWSITVTPSPGTNFLAVQAYDVSGGQSAVVWKRFFYKTPAVFTLSKTGSGSGVFSGSASITGDTPPTNGAMLNIGETYFVTAHPSGTSRFGGWSSSGGAGSSQATMPFIMQAGLTLTATFTEIPPVVSILSPTPNQRSSAPILSGTASGFFPITNVSYSLANTSGGAVINGFATMAESGAATRWTIPATPSPGTNVLTVFCTDSNGVPSAAASRKFFYIVPSKLTVTGAGAGKGSFKGTAFFPGETSPANGALLNIGEDYSIQALPNASSLFSNWVDSVDGSITTTPTLRFIMQSNLMLSATFATNFYLTAAGTYNGLFSPPGSVTEETSGMVYNLKLQNTGAFSGQLVMADKKYSFASTFDVSSNAACTAGPLQLALMLDASSNEITGTVSGPFDANLLAELSSNALPSAEYTAVFSPLAPSTSMPPGDGYALITNHSGTVTLSGALADGSAYSQRTAVGAEGDVAIFARPAGGLLMGWINLTNLDAASENGLTWIKKSSRSSPFYTNGFTNILAVQGSLWTSAALAFNNGILVLSNAQASLTFTNLVLTNGGLANIGPLPTNVVSGSINPKTGQLRLAFDPGVGPRTIAGFGAMLQNSTNVGGYFLTKSNAGSISIAP